MIFELWDTETRNIVNAWESEAEALAEVRASVDAFGPAYVETWVLLRDDDPDSDLTLIAQGVALIERAQTTLPAA